MCKYAINSTKRDPGAPKQTNLSVLESFFCGNITADLETLKTTTGCANRSDEARQKLVHYCLYCKVQISRIESCLVPCY